MHVSATVHAHAVAFAGRVQVSDAAYEVLADTEPRWVPTGGIEVKGEHTTCMRGNWQLARMSACCPYVLPPLR